MSRLSRLLTTFALVLAAAALTASPALARKKDHDRMPDKWEKRNHLNVKKDDSRLDGDHDGLSNYGEYRAHTNPRKKDSNHNGRGDGREDFDRDHLSNSEEIRTGFDPGDADSDNDGVKDGRENAGQIVKLSATSVTIKLAVGGSLTATLGDNLVIDCTSADSGSGAGSGSGSENASVPGEDADPGDAPLPDDPTTDDSADTADAPADSAPLAARAQAGGEDDPNGDPGVDPTVADDTGGGASCGATTLKVGAMVHKAKVTRTASGPVLVSVKLVGTAKK